jgi:hypothetical protein
MKSFKVVQSNANSKGGFVTKMQCETIVADAIFGDKVSKLTYYISGTKEVAVGTEIPESALFPKYKIKEHPMLNPSTGEEFMGKWLHVA